MHKYFGSVLIGMLDIGMKQTPPAIWTFQISSPLTVTSLSDVYERSVDCFVYIEGVTLQSLIAVADLLEDKQSVWGNARVPWKEGSIIDVECALEFGRWVKMSGRRCMMTVPLERSTLCLFEHLQVDGLCIDPIVPVLGVHRLNRDACVWAENTMDALLCMNIEQVCEEDRQWLVSRGWSSLKEKAP